MTPRPQYSQHRADGNQAEIISALEKAGATVFRIGQPLDLLVGFRGTNYLLEVKQPGAKLRETQEDFLRFWTGQASVVHTTREALEVIGAVKSEWKNLSVGNVKRRAAQ